MQKVCLDFEWKCNNDVAIEASMGVVPHGGHSVDIPFCIYDKEAKLYKSINLDKIYSTVQIEMFGLQGIATLYINGQRVGTYVGAYNVVDIAAYTKAGQNTILLSIQNPYGFAGLSGGINLLCASHDVHVSNNGIFVVTRFCSPSVAFLSCNVELNRLLATRSEQLDKNTITASTATYDVVVEIFNSRGKRVSRRLKKVKVRKDTNVEFKKIRINKPLLYNEQSPNLYKVVTTIIVDGAIIDTSSTIFGIRTFSVRKKKLALNNRLLWLNGIKCDFEKGVMGVVSHPILEQKRITKIKSYGFNAVSVQGLPPVAFLDACDRLGLLVMVELVNGFFGDKSFDAFVFDREHQTILSDYIKVLRNHPSVIIYSISDCNPYTYGRNQGINFASSVVEKIRSIDNTRPITGAVTELVPTVDELQQYSSYDALNRTNDSGDLYKIAKMISSENDIFRYATKAFIDLLDFVSYRDLSHRYKRDLDLFDDRKILGVGTSIDKIEQLDVSDLQYRSNILGDFSDGAGFDLYDNVQPQYVYRQILFSDIEKSSIATYNNSETSELSKGQASWDYPSSHGQNVTVDVFSSGDVVALYLNDHLVGRSLAGRFENKKARFEVEYGAGTLKAVSYLKGFEHCETSISSVGFPHAININCDKKQFNLLDRRDLVVAEVCVVDQNGNTVDFAIREVLLTVSPECQIVSYYNNDPKFVPKTFDSNEILLPIYDGKAQIVLKGVQEGKADLVAKCDGLKTHKQKIVIKSQLPKVGRGSPKF